MIFKETSLRGAYLVELEKFEDDRGYFARTFCRNEFWDQDLHSRMVQANISHNEKKGTLRGMHYQTVPMAEAKLVQCVCGVMYDVIIDLQHNSPTYCHWEAFELSARNGQMLYVPEGFAHGFLTLEDNTTVYYLMSQFYAPEYARGVRWNDPVFGIKWPISDLIMSERDRNLPDYVK